MTLQTRLVSFSLLCGLICLTTQIAYCYGGEGVGGLKIDSNSQILSVEVARKYDADGKEHGPDLKLEMPIFKQHSQKRSIPCTIDRFVLQDCGFTPFGMGMQDDLRSYEFLIKSEDKNFYEVLSNTSIDSGFISKKPVSGYTFKVIPLKEWIVITRALRTSDRKPVAMYKYPGRTKIGDCDTYYWDGSEDKGLEVPKSSEFNGNWLKVTCNKGKTCTTLSKKEVERDPTYAKEVLEEVLHLPSCPIGWIRWRSESSELLVVPISRPDHC